MQGWRHRLLQPCIFWFCWLISSLISKHVTGVHCSRRLETFHFILSVVSRTFFWCLFCLAIFWAKSLLAAALPLLHSPVLEPGCWHTAEIIKKQLQLLSLLCNWGFPATAVAKVSSAHWRCLSSSQQLCVFPPSMLPDQGKAADWHLLGAGF